MRKYFIIVVMIVALAPLAADRGGIPYRPDVRIFEPGQKAVIAFNGEEQILYLSTDLYASDDVRVVELVPFPSKPEVKEGEADVLKRLQRFLAPVVGGWRKEVDGAGKAAERGGGVEIIEFKKIGAHNITLLHATSVKAFIDWIEGRIGADNIRNAPFRNRLYTVIRHYIESGFQFFAFDEIELTKAKRTVEPLEYRFKTPFPYYPLVVSSLMFGNTSITLCFATPEAEPLADILPKSFLHLIPAARNRRVGYRQTDPENFSRIWRNGASLFTSVVSVQVSLFRYRGTLNFKTDIPDVKGTTKRGSCLAKLLKKEAERAFRNRKYALALELYKDIVCLRWCCVRLADEAERRIKEITSDREIMEQMPVEAITRDIFLKYRRCVGYALCGAKESAKRILKSITSSTTSPTMNAKVKLLQKLIDELE